MSRYFSTKISYLSMEIPCISKADFRFLFHYIFHIIIWKISEVFLEFTLLLLLLFPWVLSILWCSLSNLCKYTMFVFICVFVWIFCIYLCISDLHGVHYWFTFNLPSVLWMHKNVKLFGFHYINLEMLFTMAFMTLSFRCIICRALAGKIIPTIRVSIHFAMKLIIWPVFWLVIVWLIPFIYPTQELKNSSKDFHFC